MRGPNAKAQCHAKEPPFVKGQIRLGTLVDFHGNTSFAWRHWGCTSRKIIENIKQSLGDAEELDGFENLQDEDKTKVCKAWEEGHVDASDVLETQDVSIALTEEEEKELKKKRRVEKAKAKRAEKKVTEGGGDVEEDVGEAEKKVALKNLPAAAKPTSKAKGPASKAEVPASKVEPGPKEYAAAQPGPKEMAPVRKTAAAAKKKDEDTKIAGPNDKNVKAAKGEEEARADVGKRRKRTPTSKAGPKPASKKTKPASTSASKNKNKAAKAIEEEDDKE